MNKPALAEFADAAQSKDWPLPDRGQWERMSLDDSHTLVQRLHASYVEGATIFNARTSQAARESGTYTCIVCKKKKPLTVGEGANARPGWVWRDDRPNPNTGVYSTRAICSQECHFRGTNSGGLTNAKVASNVHK